MCVFMQSYSLKKSPINIVSCYFEIQISRLQHRVTPIFHISCGEFVERIHWLFDEQLLDKFLRKRPISSLSKDSQ